MATPSKTTKINNKKQQKTKNTRPGTTHSDTLQNKNNEKQQKQKDFQQRSMATPSNTTKNNNK